MKGLALVVAAGLLLTGCSTKIRTITANVMTEKGAYVAYWEGTCRPFLGCGIGDGKATFCVLNPDNSLTCTEQQSVSELLARKQKKE